MKNVTYYLLFVFISHHSYAMLQTPCMDKDSRPDLSCECTKSNSCYKSIDKLDKKILKYSIKTQRQKKKFKVMKKVYKLEEQLFSNQIKPGDKEFNQVTKISNKLEKLSKKNIKEYQKLLKSQGVKKWEFKKRVKAVESLMEKTIPKESLEALDSGESRVNFIEFMKTKLGKADMNTDFIGDSSSTPKEYLDKQLETAKKIEIQKSRESTKKDENINENLLAIKNASELAKKEIKNKKYKLNDIHPRHLDLFKIINTRYIVIKDRLEQYGDKEFRNRELIKRTFRGFKQLVRYLK